MKYVLVLMLLHCLAAGAQTGQVLDKNSQPLANASVSLLRSTDSLLLKSTISDSQGLFSLESPTGQLCLIYITAVGYKPVYISASPGQLQIKLEKKSESMKEVIVMGKKPLIEIKSDKLIFNVEGSINASGSNGLELLQKSPGVIIDKDDNIILSGKNGVRIYLDGKPTPLAGTDLSAYLRSLNSNDIEAIEIITNPSSKYDAAGNAGIINIRLKKNKNFGWNGTINGGYGIGIYSKYTAGISLNYRNKRLNFFSTYSSSDNKNQSRLDFFRWQNDTIYDQHSSGTSRGETHNLKTGIDFFLSGKSTLGILVNGSLGNTGYAGQSETTIKNEQNDLNGQRLNANGQSKAQRKNLSLNLNYKYSDSTGKLITIDLDQGWYQLRNNGYTPNVYSDLLTGAKISTYIFSTSTPADINLTSIKGDYEKNLKKGRISLGLKAASVQTDNIFQFFNHDQSDKPIYDKQRSNQFVYKEWILAAYTQYQAQTKKFDYQVGLRLEQTNSEGNLASEAASKDRNVKRKYLDLFPGAGVTWKVNAINNLGISFSRRIDRPRYQDLNPFENKIDELSYQKGNPFLKPQYTNVYELRHTYKYKLTTSVTYSDVKDFFAQVSDTIEGKRTFIMQRNLSSQKVVSLNVSYPFNITEWWSVYANVSIYHTRYRSTFEAGKSINLDVTVGSIYQQQTFNLGKKWNAELSGFFNSPSIWAGTYKTRSIWTLDAGLQKRFWNDNANFKLSVTDIFLTMPWSGTSRFGGLQIMASGRWESRQLKANFSYRFGNKKMKAATSRKTGLDELNNRVN